MLDIFASMVTGILPADAAAPSLSAADARTIAKDAYIYGFPLVDSLGE